MKKDFSLESFPRLELFISSDRDLYAACYIRLIDKGLAGRSEEKVLDLLAAHQVYFRK